jgi:hypothetical protein
MPEISMGNARRDGGDFGGWFVGNLAGWNRSGGTNIPVRQFGYRQTKTVEIKWGVHSRGEVRPGGWSGLSEGYSISLLVRGVFKLTFGDPVNPEIWQELRLEHEGDYILWGPGIAHTWQALADSVVLTVRWVD